MFVNSSYCLLLIIFDNSRTGATKLLFVEQVLELAHELIDVFEGAIDGGEADVGDFVELVDFFHDEFAHGLDGDFFLVLLLEFALDAVDEVLDLVETH